MLSVKENARLTRVGPGTPMGELMRCYWHPIAASAELLEEPTREVKLLGEELVLFRDRRGNLGLIDRYCAHRRVNMAVCGLPEDDGLRCAYHGWKFDAAGRCLEMPNEPAESNFKHKVRLTAYSTQERGGVIWAYMGPRETIADFPQVKWALLPESQRYVGKILIDCNYIQAMEGEIDNSHVSFLHSTLDPQAALLTRSDTMRQPYSPLTAPDKAPRGIVKQTDYGVAMGWRREQDGDQYFWHINHWLMPAYTLIAAMPGKPFLCNVRVPIDDERTWFFRIRWTPDRPLTANELDDFRDGGVLFAEKIPGSWRPVRNKDNDYLIDRALQKSYSYTGIKGINEQDMAVMESMGPKVDRSREHLGTSDVVIIAVRRSLLKAASALQDGAEPYAAHRGELYAVRPVDVLLKRGVPFDEEVKELLMARA